MAFNNLDILLRIFITVRRNETVNERNVKINRFAIVPVSVKYPYFSARRHLPPNQSRVVGPAVIPRHEQRQSGIIFPRAENNIVPFRINSAGLRLLITDVEFLRDFLRGPARTLMLVPFLAL